MSGSQLGVKNRMEHSCIWLEKIHSQGHNTSAIAQRYIFMVSAWLALVRFIFKILTFRVSIHVKIFDTAFEIQAIGAVR
jgi:preprotein translocase subunit Sec63